MVKTIEMEKIKFKELAAAIKVLNDSGKMDPKIPTVGKSKEELVKLFIDGVQAIPDEANGDWTGPLPAAVYYQKITISEETAPPQKAEKAAKTPKEKKEKVAKVPKEKKVAVYTRIDATVAVILEDGKVEDDLADKADALYAKTSGKNANINEAKTVSGFVVKTLIAANVLDENKCVQE